MFNGLMHTIRAAAVAAMLAAITACGPLVTPTGFDSFTAPLGYDDSDLTTRLRAAAVSMESARDDKAANLATIERLVDAVLAEHPDTDVTVFPELCTSWLWVEADPTGYYRSVAETIPGPTTDAIRALAMDRGVAVVVGLAEVDGERYYNSQALLQRETRGTSRTAARRARARRRPSSGACRSPLPSARTTRTKP